MPCLPLVGILLFAVNPAARACPEPVERACPELVEGACPELVEGTRPAPVLPTGETVVLLHGLGLGGWAMKRFETALKRDGYRVVNLSYPSRRVPLGQLAAVWLPRALRESGASASTRLHFVTHSMGGIVLRFHLRDHAIAHPGNVVMLAPPNSGSEVVDKLANFPPFRWITGVNGVQLGTGPDSMPRMLGPWPACPALVERACPEPVERACPALVENAGAGRLGIIAGDRSLNPLFSAWIPGPNDGEVSVASAKLAGMSDFLVLHHSHTWLLWSGKTINQVRTFLRTGHFDHSAQPGRL
jgi:triacylglycerol lipase